MDEQLADILRRYTVLALCDGMKAHIWWQVNQMAQEHSVFRDLPDLLTKQMKAINDSLPRTTNNP